MLKILSSATLSLASFTTHADIKDAPLDFTQPPSIYNADYVDIVGEETREHEDLKREYSLAIEPKYKSKRNRMASQPQVLSKTASQVATETGCPNLAIGGGTLVAFNTEGSSYCVSTVVDAETKIEGLMLNIPSTVNYDLFFFKYEDDGQFTLIDSSVTPGSTINLLVRSAAGNPPPISAQYSLVAHAPGSAESVDGFKVWNNENLTKLLILEDVPPQTASVEAHNLISFSGDVKDSNNQPVPLSNVIVDLYSFNIDSGSYEFFDNGVIAVDDNGHFNSSIKVKDCVNEYVPVRNVHNRVHSGTPTNPSEWWDIFYNAGHYSVYLANENGERSDTPVKQGSFYHICKEELVKMCYYEKNYQTGGQKWTCLN